MRNRNSVIALALALSGCAASNGSDVGRDRDAPDVDVGNGHVSLWEWRSEYGGSR